jgi:hypothetical protein
MSHTNIRVSLTSEKEDICVVFGLHAIFDMGCIAEMTLSAFFESKFGFPVDQDNQ